MFAVFSDILMKAIWEKEIERQEQVLNEILDMISEEGRQQAGIVSVLNIYESLKEEDQEEKNKLEDTLQQSMAKVKSLVTSKVKVEARLQSLRNKVSSITSHV